jgi:hypothetical protein
MIAHLAGSPDEYNHRLRKAGIMEENNLTGYARIIGNALMPLNQHDVFRKKYSNCHKQFILDSPHWVSAALIVVHHGRLSVDGIGKEPADEFRRMIDDSDAYLEMSTYDFLAFAMKRLTLIGLLRRWLNHNMRIKRPLRLLTLYRIYHFLDS